MRACVLIRQQPCYRRDAFAAGLKACGWDVTYTPDLGADALVIWNRYGVYDRHAQDFERMGKPVLVAENGYLGREWQGRSWYALSSGHHNGAGHWPMQLQGRALPPSVLRPWRQDGEEIVVLAQRGIGEEGVRQPNGWHDRAAAMARQRWPKKIVRVRAHPGENGAPVTLEEDLRNAWACVTWGSGAAVKALVMGVPVFYGFKHWVGRFAASALDDTGPPFLGSRDFLLTALGTAMWRLDEIESGEPFRYLLSPAGKGKGAAGVPGVLGGVLGEGVLSHS